MGAGGTGIKKLKTYQQFRDAWYDGKSIIGGKIVNQPVILMAGKYNDLDTLGFFLLKKKFMWGNCYSNTGGATALIEKWVDEGEIYIFSDFFEFCSWAMEELA